MVAASVAEIEKQISALPASDQWHLVDVILDNLRKKADEAKQFAELAAMAADPAIQREIHQIQKELSTAEAERFRNDCLRTCAKPIGLADQNPYSLKRHASNRVKPYLLFPWAAELVQSNR